MSSKRKRVVHKVKEIEEKGKKGEVGGKSWKEK